MLAQASTSIGRFQYHYCFAAVGGFFTFRSYLLIPTAQHQQGLHFLSTSLPSPTRPSVLPATSSCLNLDPGSCCPCDIHLVFQSSGCDGTPPQRTTTLVLLLLCRRTKGLYADFVPKVGLSEIPIGMLHASRLVVTGMIGHGTITCPSTLKHYSSRGLTQPQRRALLPLDYTNRLSTIGHTCLDTTHATSQCITANLNCNSALF